MEASWWTDPKQLDDDQKKVVALAINKDHVIIGPPGCGKTNLLLLRATYLHKKGIANIKVLTFGRVLREFIATGAPHYPFHESRIQTYVRWGAELLAANSIQLEESNDFAQTRIQLYDLLSALARRRKLENTYDVILLDEAQDYAAEEIELIRSFGERVFVVGDSNQQITEKTGALERIEALGAEKTTLKHHYRNGLKICRVADGIKNLIDHPDGLEFSSNYDETDYPSTVDTFGNLSLSEQVSTAVTRVKTQLQAYPGEMIGLLCARSEDLAAAKASLEVSSVADELQVQRSGAYAPFSPDRPVVLTTIQGAKGLEFRAVHLIAADKLRNFRTQRNLTYTAVTRTKTSLSIYHDGVLAGYFEKGLNACKATKPIDPSLDDLFL